LIDVLWNGPAWSPGLTVGTQIIAVNGISYDTDRLKEIIRRARTDPAPIEFLVKNGDRYTMVHIDYHDGPRYPHLQQVPGVPARLDQILTPRG
jgi:predicted metalloprotease with PDZ domain